MSHINVASCAGSERDASYAKHARSSPVPQSFSALCFAFLAYLVAADAAGHYVTAYMQL